MSIQHHEHEADDQIFPRCAVLNFSIYCGGSL
ncbi:hypothetical protein WG8_1497 [Paenibacillus sp. Aloe-11]|nr:hypothetical protein WG8_1497 [Paenibacillus sp. Aloe-11]